MRTNGAQLESVGDFSTLPIPEPEPEPESNRYSVPGTGDNSNVALWTVLLFAFGAAAIVSRKKKV